MASVPEGCANTSLIAEEFFGPGLFDDAVAFFEGRAVGVIDGVVLMGLSAMYAMGLLRHDIDPSALVPTCEASVDPPAGHMIDHRDVFGDTNRIVGREYDAELANAQALGLHPD